MSAYGCRWVQTPAFDRVAREGCLFTRAYTPNAKCAPSRACILTGRNSWQLKAACNHIPYFPAEFPTYAEVLGQHGYFVGMTVKGWSPGVAQDAQGQDRQMAGRPFNRRTAAAAHTAHPADRLRGELRATSWPPCRPTRRGASGTGASNRTAAMNSAAVRPQGESPCRTSTACPGCWPDNETVRNDLLDYAFELEYFDSHLGRMLQLLEQRGELDNTLIVVTADNGMPFPRAKGQAYELSNHLPLAIMWKERHPSCPAGPWTTMSASLIWHPTFIELAGLDWGQTGMAPAAGKSLTDIFHSDRCRAGHRVARPRADRQGAARCRAPARLGLSDPRHREERSALPAQLRAVALAGRQPGNRLPQLRRQPHQDPDPGPAPAGTDVAFWNLAFGKRPAEELYDLRQDPDCLRTWPRNRSTRRSRPNCATSCFENSTEQGDPRMAGQGHVFDEYPYAKPAHQNFYERFMRGEKLSAGWVNPSDFELPRNP